MKKLLILLASLYCVSIAESCPPMDCDKKCDTGISRIDLELCQCVCYVQRDDIRMKVSRWAEIEEGVGKAVSNNTGMWTVTNAAGCIRIPFCLSPELEASESHKNAIIGGLGVLNAITCLKFEPALPDDIDKIEFFKGTGCWSYIGRTGGTQRISLKDGCDYVGIVEHEVMHALGIWHEQSRPDRDNYVLIHFDNIIPGKEHNFYKKPADEIDSYGSPYDFGSVMHYSSYAFSDNGQRTITKIDGSGYTRQRYCPSHEDQLQINAMHSCNGKRGIPETIDCYHPLDRGFSYRGTQSTTESGKTCQAWNSTSPHYHYYDPDVVTGAGLEENYCRNPDADTVGPWCYTTDSQTQREVCQIPHCANAVPEISLTAEETWNEWGNYSSCNKLCGNGKKMRVRTCSTGTCSTGRPFQKATCNNQDCSTPVWGPYGAWSGCHCNRRKRYAVRQCVGGYINEGGCTGKAWKSGSCTCSGATGTWDAWGSYSSCNKQCGNGRKMRVRACSTNNCPTGRPFQKKTCKNQDCSTPMWSPYSGWSGCQCNTGKRYRVRQCNGGFITEGDCTGRAWQIRSCACSYSC